MHRVTKRVLIFGLLVLPALLGAAAIWYLPHAEVPLSQELPDAELIPVAFAEIRDGGPDHPAAGNVTLYLNNETNEWFLYFQGYRAEAGREARFFLTEEADPQTRGEVDRGVRLSVPERGRADARGDFLVPIPEEVDPRDHAGLVAWDLRFDQRHSVATLTPYPADDT